jgi:XTP/dITP diphosphohydrolase
MLVLNSCRSIGLARFIGGLNVLCGPIHQLLLSSYNMKPLLIATFNPGKIKEFQHFLAGLAFDFIGLEQLPEIPKYLEIGESFETIARQKALHFSLFSKCLTLADDSGLEVDALGGLPGVHSARFLGESASDVDRYIEVLRQLSEIPDPQRMARFVCCLALAREGEILAEFRGVFEGSITLEPRGNLGFGYDPIFLVPSLHKTVAELPMKEKERISHRGKALLAMRNFFLNSLEKGSPR